MNRMSSALLLAAFSAAAIAARADVIPYPNAGTIAPTSVITASSTGAVTGYFVQGGYLSGGNAGDDDVIYMYDKTTNTLTGPFFDNQLSNAGDTANFGNVNAGDVLVFELYDLSQKANGMDYIEATDPAYSQDGVNHGYVTSFSGGVLNGVNFPAGIYVGMEDLATTEFSDFNYTDDTFIFTNVGSTPASATPEPSSLLLLGSGALGLAGAVRRRVRR
jgi:hypothetical protein